MTVESPSRLQASGDWEVRLVALADIHPSPWNPRTITQSDFEALCASLERWPRFLLDRPAIVQAATGDIAAGNMRYRGMLRLAQSGSRYPSLYRCEDGRPGMPARVRDMSDAETKALALIDNNILGEYQAEELGEILHDLSAIGIDPATLSFKPVDLETLLEASGSGATEHVEFDAADEIPDEPEEPITRVGDLWTLGRHRLLCADMTDAAEMRRLVGNRRVDLCVTSPPYWIGREYEREAGREEILGHIEKAARSIATAMPEDGHIALNTGTTIETQQGGSVRRVWLLLDWWAEAFERREWYLRNVRIWRKEGGFSSFSPAQDVVGQDWEFLASLTRSKPRPQNRVGERWALDGVWDCQPQTQSVGHSAPFPVEIPRRFIDLYTETGDVVLDPYLGSGTTLVAAETQGRTALGLDIDPRACDVAVARWERLTGETAVRE